MKKNIKKSFILSATTGLLIVLWLYAALTKLIDYPHFIATLQHSPLLDQLAIQIGWTLLTVEIGFVILLLVPKLQAWGLYGSAILLLLFSAYILYMLLYAAHLPCSCGGVIQKLSWKQHLIFNGAFLLISVLGIRSLKAVHR
jgi:hypothetical protein